MSTLKTLRYLGLAILTVALSGVAAENAGDSQQKIITLKDGTRLTFLGLTHGNRHYPPGYESLSTVNSLYFGEDKTVAWVQAEHEPAKWPSFELLVFDKANTGCVPTEKQTSSHVRNGVDVLGFVLKAFPRWDKEMILRARPYHGATADGQFVVANRDPRPFENWTAEEMPITKSEGNFEVTLATVIAGAPLPHWQGETPLENNLANQCVRIAFGFRENGRLVTNWNARLVKTSDASGNVVQGVISDYPRNGIFQRPPNLSPNDGYFYRPGLWPGQSPWKVRLEFTRTSGFREDEVLILKDLPVRAGSQEEADEQWSWDKSKTNFTYTTSKVNGVRVTLLEPLVYSASILNGEKHIRVMIYTDPSRPVQELRLTLIEATDDKGQRIWSPFQSAWAGHFDLDFPRPGEVRSLNLKLALHKSRFVEFTVKPAKM